MFKSRLRHQSVSSNLGPRFRGSCCRGRRRHRSCASPRCSQSSCCCLLRLPSRGCTCRPRPGRSGHRRSCQGWHGSSERASLSGRDEHKSTCFARPPWRAQPFRVCRCFFCHLGNRRRRLGCGSRAQSPCRCHLSSVQSSPKVSTKYPVSSWRSSEPPP